MSNPNIKPSAVAPIIKVLDPVSQGAGTVTTGWVSMADSDAVLAILQVGAMSASSTVDAKLQQATDSSGTGAKDITGKAITQLTQAGTDSNKQVEINCWSHELDVAGGFNHVRLSVTVAAAASLISALVLSFYGRYETVTDSTTVDEIVG